MEGIIKQKLKEILDTKTVIGDRKLSAGEIAAFEGKHGVKLSEEFIRDFGADMLPIGETISGDTMCIGVREIGTGKIYYGNTAQLIFDDFATNFSQFKENR